MSERKALAARLRITAQSFFADSAGTYRDLRAAADLLDPPARGRTVRVRIACAVNKSGEWNARGWNECTDPSSFAAEGCPDVASVRWIECEVPLPEETTVEGEVQP